jgi:guanine nucleotide-binding protein G(I)/G(S)/G(T) subunit beta-1
MEPKAKDDLEKENEELTQRIHKILIEKDDVSKNPGNLFKNNILATAAEGKVEKLNFKALQKGVLKPRLTLKGHAQKVYSLDWAEEKPYVVSASQDGRMVVWDCVTGCKMNAIPSSWTMACAFSPDARFVSNGGMKNDITVYSLKEPEGSLSLTLKGHNGYISKLRYWDNKQLLSSSGDGTCMLWDLESGNSKITFEGHGGDVQSVAPFVAQNIFVSGSVDKTAKIWDVRNKACVQTFYEGHTMDVNDAQFFPNGNAIVTACDDGKLRLFDLRAGRMMSEYTDSQIKPGVSSVAFSLSGRLIFSGHDDFTCRVWDTLYGELLTTLTSHDEKVSCLGISKDGMALATGSWDNTVLIWA